MDRTIQTDGQTVGQTQAQIDRGWTDRWVDRRVEGGRDSQNRLTSTSTSASDTPGTDRGRRDAVPRHGSLLLQDSAQGSREQEEDRSDQQQVSIGLKF